MAMDTDIILLDEPTANLDYLAIKKLKEILLLLKKEGKTRGSLAACVLRAAPSCPPPFRQWCRTASPVPQTVASSRAPFLRRLDRVGGTCSTNQPYQTFPMPVASRCVLIGYASAPIPLNDRTRCLEKGSWVRSKTTNRVLKN